MLTAVIRSVAFQNPVQLSNSLCDLEVELWLKCQKQQYLGASASIMQQ